MTVTTSTYIPVIVILKERGDGFFPLRVKAEGLRDVGLTDNIHPYLEDIVQNNTFEKVLTFLNNVPEEILKDTAYSFYHINLKNGRNIAAFKTMHGDCHPCSVAKMIDYVKIAMNHANRGDTSPIPHEDAKL